MSKNKIVEKNPKRANRSERLPRLLSLDIDQIALYDRNPRKVRNPEYERIKQSIAKHGLEQPLIVTKRPGENAYLVNSGGNTRLQILKDLFGTTGDPCYGTANCIEVGWKDESNVLLGHLLENSIRGDLTFIDQAVAVTAYGEMLAEEHDAKPLSIRELQLALKDKGLPISIGVLSRMRYAADVLSGAMPVALSDGIGHRSVAEISKLHREAARLWVRTDLGNEAEFDDVFIELCRRYDGPDWQLEPLQRAVEIEIAEAGEVSVQTVRISLDASRFAAQPTPSQLALPSTARSDAPVTSHQAETSAESAADAADNAEPKDRMLTVRVEVEGDENRDRSDNTKVQESPFVELRRKAYGLANSLASGFRLGELVLPLPECGNGFLLGDFPCSELLASADADSRATIGTMWWQLFAFSETASAPINVIEARLQPESGLRRALENSDIDMLFDRIDIINAAHFADRFWARLPRREWQDWLYLAHTHREIRRMVIETERPLWPREL